MTSEEIKKLSARLHNGSQIKVYYSGNYLTDATVTEIVLKENAITIFYKPYHKDSGGKQASCDITETGLFSIEIVGSE